MSAIKNNASDTSSSKHEYGVLGSLEARLASTSQEVEDALSLRFQIFCDELHLGNSGSVDNERIDRDEWDDICDHLLIFETENKLGAANKLVATSRLLTSSSAKKHGLTFYSQSEFDVNSLRSRHGDKEFLELGRTCVSPEYRTHRCIELLWHSIWAYSLDFNIDVMVGCASFHGTDVEEFTDPLAYLYHYHTAGGAWETEAKSDPTHMNLKPKNEIDRKKAFRQLPPLIKGYLRLGASTSHHAVIDRDFGTVDVLIILPVEHLNPRHVSHYGQNAERYAGLKGKRSST